MSSSPSAPRLPLSPASPPESGVKQQPKSQHPALTPQTPPSPPHMSVATKRYVSSYGNQHTDEMATRSPSESYAQSSQRPNTNMNTSQQSNALKRPLPQDVEERPTSKRQRKDLPEDAMEVDSTVAATNHDRQEPQQGHRTVGIDASAEQAESSRSGENALMSAKPAMESFGGDTGPADRLRTSTLNRPSIDLRKHMIGTYGLGPLLETVARHDPKTMEKINKLRKSYEGQIKAAQLSGRNKTYAAPKDPNDFHDPQWGPLRVIADKKDEEWEEDLPQAKIGDLSSLKGRLTKALKLNPGTMNKATTAEWDDSLGHEVNKRPAMVQTPVPSYQHPQQAQQARIPNGVRQVLNAAVGSDKMRTRGKKRSYDDSSFSGYRGYADGYSEPDDNQSDGDGNWADRRKRRKD